MALDHYVTLGRSGLRVSPFCLGTMTFGEDWGWGSSPETSREILAAYLDRGGNFIDTANNYNFGHSEKIIGDHFAGAGVRRDRAVIATKFYSNNYARDPNGGGAGRKAILQQCENSLRRLRTDYIDLYWLHAYDVDTPIEETLRALEDLVAAGKVRYIGFSDTPAWKCAEAQTIARFRGWAPLIAVQIEYSLLQRTVEGDLVPMALDMGLGITPWGPLKGGLLSGKFTRANDGKVASTRAEMVAPPNERAYVVIDVLEAIARDRNATVAAVALAWLQCQPGVSSAIIGARTLPQLEGNLTALDLTLGSDELARLAEVSAPKLNFPAAFLATAPNVAQAGATVNRRKPELYPIIAQREDQIY